MAKPRNKILDYVYYVAVRLGAMFIYMSGWRTNYRLFRLLAEIVYRVDGKHRRRGLENLKATFPEMSDRERIHLVKASLRSLMYLGLELHFSTRLITPMRWRKHMRLRNEAENVRLLVERKTGLIYVTGHFGNWEVIGYTLAALGFPSYAIARKLDNPYLNEYILGVRQKKGLTILDKKGAGKSLDQILDDKGVVSFMADQDAGRKGLFVDFFGRPASTFKTPALMAMRHETPIVVVYGRRLGEDFTFELGVQRIIHPHEWADKDDPLRWITQTYTSALEEVIRTDMRQYLWVHRRWKHQPPQRRKQASPVTTA